MVIIYRALILARSVFSYQLGVFIGNDTHRLIRRHPNTKPMMSPSKVQTAKMIDSPNTMKLLDGLATEKRPLGDAKSSYEKLVNKLQENYHVSFLIVART